jgi:hypothetical protein
MDMKIEPAPHQPITLTAARLDILDHTVKRAAGGFYCGGGPDMDAGRAALAAGETALLWLCSEPTISSDNATKPEADDDGCRFKSKKPITAEEAAEIAAETSDRLHADGDELAVWVWRPGGAARAMEYFVRVTWSVSFSARLASEP